MATKKIKDLGIEVMFDTVVTTMNKKMKTSGGVLLPESGQVMTKQTVLAVGPNVPDNLKVGMEIEIDTGRFPKKKVPAQHDIGPDRYEVIPPVEQIGSDLYLFIDSRAIKWIYTK